MTLNKKFKKIIFILLFIFLLVLTGCNATFDIELGYKKLNLCVGESVLLDTNYVDLNEDGVVSWSSSNEAVATVNDEGLVNAISVGYTYITATFNSHSTKIYLSVTESIEDTRTLKITGDQMVIVNENSKLEAEIDLKDEEVVCWTSSNENILKVDQDGNLTGLKTGLVTVKAYLSTNESIYDEITILVRTGSGVQDVIYNYIYNSSYVLDGTLDFTSLSEKVENTVANTRDAVLGVSNYVLKSNTLVLDSVGSCVIYKKEVIEGGYKYTVLTNEHVVDGADSLKIYIGNDVDEEFEATLVKSDEELDLAIVTFNYDKELPVLSFGNNDDINNGDFVIAIGNPNGYSYYNSVTFGVVSYVNRTLSGEKSTFVQHDAAINSGNSGGPLINMNGEIIGINTLKIAKTTVEGMGFAIDLNTIKGFMNE